MIKKEMGNQVEQRLNRMEPDSKQIYLLCDDTIRLTAVSGTRMVAQMQANHETGVLETVVLGKAYLAGALLSSCVKERDRIILRVECGGPIKGYEVEAWASGAVRGFLVQNPLPLEKPLASSDLSDLYGPGFLSVVKILEGAKDPFTGQVMIEHGNLAKDLTLYFDQSEQTPSAFDLSIQFNNDGTPSGAGGLFFQGLPGAPEENLKKLDDALGRIKPLGAYLESGRTLEEYILSMFADLKPRKLSQTVTGFSCPCTKEKCAGYLMSMKEEQRRDLAENGPFPLTLTCNHCNSHYDFSQEELTRLLNVPADKEKKL